MSDNTDHIETMTYRELDEIVMLSRQALDALADGDLEQVEQCLGKIEQCGDNWEGLARDYVETLFPNGQPLHVTECHRTLTDERVKVRIDHKAQPLGVELNFVDNVGDAEHASLNDIRHDPDNTEHGFYYVVSVNPLPLQEDGQ